MKYGMVINYGYCTNCHSCEVSCRKEKELPLEEWGIKVLQVGPQKLAGEWEWDYLPVPSSLCDMCEERIEDGKLPLCQLHCLADVIRVVPVDRIGEEVANIGAGKTTCFVRS